MNDIVSSNLDHDMKNSWGTDPVIFNAMNKEFNFLIDVAANDNNALCNSYLTKDDDALKTDWYDFANEDCLDVNIGPFSAWCNPPYGRGFIKAFMNQAINMRDKGITTVMLVPATLDAQWLPLHSISEIRIVTGGRLSFYHPITGKKVNGNTKGSMFVIFRPSDMPCFVRLINRKELLFYGEIND